MKINNKTKGDQGEKLAVEYLKSKNYKILLTNYRAAGAEIDIIAKDNEYIVFVEVKYRSNDNLGKPREAVNYHKQLKIRKGAMYYIVSKYSYEPNMRFDVIEILGTNIEHIENAF